MNGILTAWHSAMLVKWGKRLSLHALVNVPFNLYWNDLQSLPAKTAGNCFSRHSLALLVWGTFNS